VRGGRDEVFRDAGHLPKQRPGGEPVPPERLPRQRRGTTPQLHGRHPDYDVLELAPHWDEVTRKVVKDRAAISPAEPLRFFTEAEGRALSAFCDTFLAQDADPRVPVLAMVDAKYADGKLDGYRHDGLPPDPETWRRVAAGLDEAAGGDFAGLGDEERRGLVERFSRGALSGGVWDELPCSTAWSVVTRGALSAFYSHPWAWNEIGYGGPRYPRGYLRLAAGQEEPGVAPERFAADPVSDVKRRGLEG
jgi:hypothetical protein